MSEFKKGDVVRLTEAHPYCGTCGTANFSAGMIVTLDSNSIRIGETGITDDAGRWLQLESDGRYYWCRAELVSRAGQPAEVIEPKVGETWWNASTGAEVTIISLSGEDPSYPVEYRASYGDGQCARRALTRRISPASGSADAAHRETAGPKPSGDGPVISAQPEAGRPDPYERCRDTRKEAMIIAAMVVVNGLYREPPTAKRRRHLAQLLGEMGRKVEGSKHPAAWPEDCDSEELRVT